MDGLGDGGELKKAVVMLLSAAEEGTEPLIEAQRCFERRRLMISTVVDDGEARTRATVAR